MAIKVKRKIEKEKLRTHLERLAEDAVAILKDYYPANKAGTPRDLKKEDVYIKFQQSQTIIIGYEHKGHRYSVEISRL